MCLAYAMLGLGTILLLGGIATPEISAIIAGSVLIVVPLIFIGVKEGLEKRYERVHRLEIEKEEAEREERIRLWKEDFNRRIQEHKEQQEHPQQRTGIERRIKPFSFETNVGTLELVEGGRSQDGQMQMRVELNGEELASIRSTDASEVLEALQQSAKKNFIEIKVGDESFGYWGIMDKPPEEGEDLGADE